MIPKTWTLSTIGEIFDTTSGGTPSRKVDSYYRGNIPWVKSGELNYNIIYDTEEKITEDAIANSSAKLFPKGTLLIALYGATIGKLAILGLDASTNQAICGIYGNNLCELRYVYYFFFLKRQKIIEMSVGGAQPNISQQIIRSIHIPLPPIAEQGRIVAKIEELFSNLDNGIKNLENARDQLKIYRQAVLKYAFEGKLTETWRNQHAHSLEPAEQLLKKIKHEREKQYDTRLEEWEKKVKEWQANGKEGKKPSKPSKPKDLPPLTEAELKELPKLPDGWSWMRLGNICLEIFDGPFGSNLKTDDYVDKGVRVIRLENIDNLKFINSKKSFITEQKYQALKRHTVVAGDLIFSSFISDYTKVVLLPSYIDKAVNKADCFCVRLSDILSNRYIEFFLSTNMTHKQLSNEVHGATRPRINTTQLKQIVLPISNINEQREIVSEIEARLSVCDKLEQTVNENLKKAEALRQSILKKAFEGKLVPQNPDDEPAQKLLQRINAQKEKRTKQ